MIETEKKYKLDKESFETIKTYLEESKLYFSWTDKEENILYSGNPKGTVLRIRKTKRLIGNEFSEHHKAATTLTVKGLSSVTNGIKSRTELETAIRKEFIPALEMLGYAPKLVYEKIRNTFNRANTTDAEIVLDELPFGYYMEIEGTKEQIEKAEDFLPYDLSEDVERYSYPDLTKLYGKSVNGVMEARFKD